MAYATEYILQPLLADYSDLLPGGQILPEASGCNAYRMIIESRRVLRLNQARFEEQQKFRVLLHSHSMTG